MQTHTVYMIKLMNFVWNTLVDNSRLLGTHRTVRRRFDFWQNAIFGSILLLFLVSGILPYLKLGVVTDFIIVFTGWAVVCLVAWWSRCAEIAYRTYFEILQQRIDFVIDDERYGKHTNCLGYRLCLLDMRWPAELSIPLFMELEKAVVNGLAMKEMAKSNDESSDH